MLIAAAPDSEFTQLPGHTISGSHNLRFTQFPVYTIPGSYKFRLIRMPGDYLLCCIVVKVTLDEYDRGSLVAGTAGQVAEGSDQIG